MDNVYAMIFRCIDDNGYLVGKLGKNGTEKLPQEVLKISGRDARYRLRMAFEFITVTKTVVSKGREFIELTGSEYSPESVTHNRMSSVYDTIYVDHPIRRYFLNDGVARISDGQASGLRWPRGNYLRALAALNDDIGYLRDSPKVFLNAARKVTRLGLHIGRSPRRQFRDLANTRARLLWAAGMPGGLVGYARDRLRGRTAPKADADISAWGPAAPPENAEIHHPPKRSSRP